MVRQFEVTLTTHELPGYLAMPAKPRGLVLFAHGSGSSRNSPRNRYAAERLNEAGFATLLFDLLNDEEASDRRNVFDIPLLGERVAAAVEWSRANAQCQSLPIGLFGASTGAAAAIVAAAQLPNLVDAVVSRGGRPDLAGDALGQLEAPTLLVVGSADIEVLALNRRAMRSMRCINKLQIIPHAGHLFEESGTLDAALDAATAWFETYLRG